MNMIKIVAISKMNFFEFCDSKKYKKHAANRLALTKYAIDSQKIILNEEK